MFLARPNTISREHLVAIGKGRRKPDAPTPFRPRWRGFEKPHQKSEEAIFFARPGSIRRESFVTIGGGRRKPDAEPDAPTPFRPRWRGFETAHPKTEEAIFSARLGST